MDDMQMVDVSDNTEKKDESKKNNKKKTRTCACGYPEGCDRCGNGISEGRTREI